MNVTVAQRGIGSRWDELIWALSGDAATTALAKAVIAHESQWVETARNPDGSTGLMQVLVGPGGPYPSMSDAQIADPATNLTLGIRFLREKLARYGPTSDAIAAYNAGTPRKNDANQYVNSRGDTVVQAYVDDVQAYWIWYLNNDPLMVSVDSSGAAVPVDWSITLDSDDQIVPAAQGAGAGGGVLVGVVVLLALALLAVKRWS